MVARRLPFDDPDVATLLELVKRGSYELDRDVFTDPDERELVVGSLNSDPTQRLTASFFLSFRNLSLSPWVECSKL